MSNQFNITGFQDRAGYIWWNAEKWAPITGSIDATLPSLEAEFATLGNSGDIDITLAPIDAVMTGQTIIIGLIDITVPALELVIGATQVNNALDAALVEPMTAECYTGAYIDVALQPLKMELSQKGMAIVLPALGMEAQSMFGEDMEFNLPSLEMTATGSPYGGTLDLKVPSIDVQMYVGKSIVTELPAIAASFTGSNGIVASVDCKLGRMKYSSYAGAHMPLMTPKLTMEAVGTVHLNARLYGTLGLMRSDMYGQVSREGHLVAGMPQFTGSFIGSVYPVGNLRVSLPSLNTLLTGLPGVVASMVMEIPEIDMKMAGGGSQDDLVAELPALTAVMSLPPEACSEYDTLRYGGM